MKAVVEEHPCLSMTEVKRAGGLENEAWVTIPGGHFQVRRVADGLEVAHHAGGQRWTAVQVKLTSHQVTYGARVEFLCPISGSRVRKLYVVEGRLGGRVALELGNLSRARPAAYRRQRRSVVGRPKGAPMTGVETSAHPVSTEEAWERGRGLQWEEEKLVKRLNRDLQHARHGEICSTRSQAIFDWGWAWRQAQLDCRVLDRLGMIEHGCRHAAAFSWPAGYGGVDTALLQTDLAGGRSPLMVATLLCDGEVSRQAITLAPFRGRWRLRCPVTGELEQVLYARARRFASRKAQYLVLGERRPAPPFGDVALVADTWAPDTDWL